MPKHVSADAEMPAHAKEFLDEALGDSNMQAARANMGSDFLTASLGACGGAPQRLRGAGIWSRARRKLVPN